jgi:hypothetical protein
MGAEQSGEALRLAQGSRQQEGRNKTAKAMQAQSAITLSSEATEILLNAVKAENAEGGKRGTGNRLGIEPF